MKLLFENKRYILSIFLTILMVFGTLMSGYADENSAPVFIDGNRAIRTIAENTAAGVNIGAPVAATDADNDTLTYSKGWLDGMAFSIDTATGQIRTKAPLDYETKNVYTFAVYANDGNGGRDVISVTINVTDVDETPTNNAPIFTDGTSTTRTVAENTAAGANIGSAIAATDADDDTLTYTLGGTDAASFSIVATSGQLRTSAALDYETKSSYAVTVSVSDDNGGSDSISVTISVTNVNETPSFPTETATRTIAENTAAGQAFGDPFQATDPDTADTVTYSLHRGDAGVFRINTRTGQLRTHMALDFETKKVYNNLAIRATDSKGKFDAIFVTINVTDVNETPSFPTETATLSVAENTARGRNIGVPFQATDPDTGDTLTYSLHRGDAGVFRINTRTGQLRTHTALDFETKKVYNDLAIRATDSKGNFDAIFVTVNVTDVNETPSFPTETATLSVAENTARGRNIGVPFQATDPDTGDILTYSLHRGDAGVFRINTRTGQLRTHTALDFETKKVYNDLAIRATDSKGNFDAIFVTVNVTDVDENRAPAFTDGTSTTRSIAENTASGTNIGTAIAATDPDTDDTLTYTLGGTDAASFSIVSTSGQLQTNAALDYETKASYSVSVSVSDGNGGNDSISVTINVTDVNENRAPAFTEGSSTTRSVAENTASGANIGSAVAATDPDTDDTLTYTLGGTDASAFSIVSTSGQLQTNAALDYETKSSYSVSVSVSDGNGGSDSITVTINVTDVDETPVNTAPTFTEGSSTTRAVNETTTIRINIGAAIAATDADDDTLTYTLSGTDADSFTISSTSGQLQAIGVLIYEIKSSYSVTVSVSDGKGGSDSITVTINVIKSVRNRTPAVRDAIVAAADVRLYSQLTPARLRGISALNLNGKLISSLQAGDFSGLTGLTKLNLASNSITDISALRGLTSLTSLNLSGNNIGGASSASNNNAGAVGNNNPRGVSVLSEQLDQNNNDLTDLSHLSGMTQLTWLNLGHNSITDISALSGMTKLERLYLHYNEITDISALSGMTKLEGLYLWNNSITDISALSSLTNLGHLAISNNSITDLSPLSSLTNLGSITMVNNSITDLSPLSSMPQLSSLHLEGNPLNGNLSHLSGLTNLWQLGLGGTSINNSSLSALSSLTSIESFFLDGTSVTDLSALSTWPTLDRVGLTNNKNLSDISILANWTSMEYLYLYDNKISDLSPLIGLTSLRDLHLRDDSISDYAPLYRLKVATRVIRGWSVAIYRDDSNGFRFPEVSNDNVPAFTDGDSTTRSIAENTASGTNFGTAVAATDTDAGDTLTYHLGGTDADSFSIVRATGKLQTKAPLDYETKSSYTVAIAVSDGKGGSDTITVTINVTDVAGAAPSVETPPVLPETTALLSNYPNPFNPETWIPYQLAEPAEVTITIYDIRGRVVRTLVLGNQPAGIYQSRSKAAHWDGRNQFGEKVATGIYFYTLKAGDYAATRKLLIRK